MDVDGGASSSHVDRVFKQALREFKDNLVATYSVAVNQNQTEKLNIKYKDLIVNFLQVMQTVSHQENPGRDFPEDRIVYLGHELESKIINIPTACEICNSLFKWPIERMLVCQNCRHTCHRKCYTRIMGECGLARSSAARSHGHRVFGVPLSQLSSSDGKVPSLVDRLITTIELRGIYTEGIYRKSGIHSKIQELKTKIDEGKLPELELEVYSVHILANLLKLFLREMPEPLLTFEYYEEFLRAADLTEDRVSTLFSILKTLPKPNFDLMERLIFHLARVAYHEEANRMTPNSLAIVFAPCILRQRHFPAQDALSDISRQTLCIELIISEQLKKLAIFHPEELAPAKKLLEEENLLVNHLEEIKTEKDLNFHLINFPLFPSLLQIFHPEELAPAKKLLEEEDLLVNHLEEIKKEKDHLTCRLPSLTRTNSDDDLLSTDDGSLDEIDAVPSSSDQSSFSSYSTKPAKIIALADQPKKHSHPPLKKRNSNNLPSDEDPIMV
ncbi:hypothetical protein M8J75_007275 [Diaphorina citri]|nr:hypothetical protein M8J75_007275 [Diaphorina citri]